MKRKLDVEPRETCIACGQKFWSRAIHCFICPAAFPDISEDERKVWERVEGETKRIAKQNFEE